MRKSGRSKKTYISIVVAVLFFVLFLAGSLLFVSSVRRRNNEQILNYLDDAVSQRRTAIARQMDGDFQVMRGLAVSLSEIDLGDGQRALSILDEINRSNSFIMMGLSNTEGRVDMVDLDGTVYPGVDISAYEAFDLALAGQDSVSITYYEPRFGEQINFYTVPVKKNDYMIGALCAINSGSVLRELIEVPVFQGEGYFGMVDSEGVFVAPVVDPNPKAKLGASVFELLEGPRGDVERLRADLAGAGGGSHYYFDIDGVRYLSASVPMGVNDWWVLCIVPERSINTYYNATSVGTVVIIGAACLVFLFLLVWQMRTLTRSQAALERLAYTDLLTGVRNYQKFMVDAEALLAQSAKRRFAVWSFDIKKFNYINDMFGSATGDKVLQRVAVLLKETETPDCFGCRVAADQFCGIRAYRSEEEVRDWFWEMYERLSRRQVIPDNRLIIDGAMGAYLVDEFDEILPVDDMVNRATIARKAAKQAAGTHISFFTQKMGQKMRWESELEASGSTSLAAGEFTFFLQPKVAVQDGFQIAGAEVLARWMHPRHGWISPGEFIPVFERNGFVVELDRYIFEAACKWYVASQKRGTPPVNLAINVSRQGLLRDDFISYYTEVRDRYGIGPGVLELEFTESMILEDYELFQDSVKELQEHGFTCSIDDFGSGYSSLNVLKNLPIDVLKLDALFFRESENTNRGKVLVENFISMARRLKIVTVAEGVETVDQVDFLQLVGCDLIQGYVFSKPLPKNEFEDLMRRTGGELTLEP